MSGILGLFNQDGAPVEPAQLQDMASLLRRRGPERTGIWNVGAVGMGHTLLATTPEAALERLPLEHSASGCVITGDIRLDNRTELISWLGLGDRAAVTGDAEIVLAAYLACGESCVERLLGDFAFAVWDPRSGTLTCARDHMGLRPLYYHHTPGQFFAFATEPRAILVLPQTPYRINEARIADFLVADMLEGFDKTSTFFEKVFRLPPAHSMTVTTEGVRQRRYWRLESESELRLASDDAYAEAFLEVFSEAVRCRLRTAGPPGATLSGGMDSGAIVAVARRILASEERSHLLTFSGVSPLGEADPETRAIRAASQMNGLEPHLVNHGALDDLRPDLEQSLSELDEPFDGSSTLLRCVYLTARQEGVNVVLDGASGDVVLTGGRRFVRLLRSGHWRTGYREAAALNRFLNSAQPPLRDLLRSAPAAFVPDAFLRLVRPLRRRLLLGHTVRGSLISAEFARHVGLGERLELCERRIATRPLTRGGVERAREIDQPYLTVARERYDRVAAALAIEPRDPFLDVRVATFCVGLPDSQVIQDGWPKIILRRAMAGQLPDAVRWRRGKEHLGWYFTRALMDEAGYLTGRGEEPNIEIVSRYVDVGAARAAWRSHLRGDPIRAEWVYSLSYLDGWLRHHAARPRAIA